MTTTTKNSIVYQARLHWIIFVWPVILLIGALYVSQENNMLKEPAYCIAIFALVWLWFMFLTYCFSSLMVKEKQVILCTGILVRQTLDLSLNKIESIDIKQSILGSLFHYGSLVVTGTGGTRQHINFLNKPLTCRRHIEQLLHT